MDQSTRDYKQPVESIEKGAYFVQEKNNGKTCVQRLDDDEVRFDNLLKRATAARPNASLVVNGLVVRQERRGICAVGWEAHNRGLSVGIGIAGNSGRFGGACGAYVNPGEKEEARREGLKDRFRINKYEIIKFHRHHDTAEESVVSNMHLTWQYLNKPAHLGLLNPDGTLKIRWGLIHPFMRHNHLRAESTMTFQGVDYTRPSWSSFKKFKKYNKAAGIQTVACFQEPKGEFDFARNYECLAVFTAGPNNGSYGNTPHSSQRRTVDPDAAIYSKFKEGVVDALEAMLKEMKHHNVQAAVIPGLSTGLYAKEYRDIIRYEFIYLIIEAIQNVGDMGSIKEIIYCTI